MYERASERDTPTASLAKEVFGVGVGTWYKQLFILFSERGTNTDKLFFCEPTRNDSGRTAGHFSQQHR